MFTPEEYDRFPSSILELYQQYEESVLVDMARRIRSLGVTPTAAWQAQRLSESGALFQDILERLSVLTGKSQRELRKLFEEAGVKAVRFDDAVYRRAGLEPLPLNLSPNMVEVLAAGMRRTDGLLRNLSGTTAVTAQQQFIAATDLAYQQVVSGAFSGEAAVRQAVSSLGANGLWVAYPSGARAHLDVAVRRAVLTGIGKTAGDVQLARAGDMGQDLVQVSAHAGARPAHQVWQGKIYSVSGTHPRYGNFEQETGYGTGPGLCGWNCRHTFYPFFEGLSEEMYQAEESRLQELNEMGSVQWQGKSLTAYEATQVQRGFERKIREWKRRAAVLQGAELEAAAELQRVRQWQARMRDFLSQTGLARQPARERV